ncbi:hypothetical protein Bca4012_094158 [Brassica carinata]
MSANIDKFAVKNIAKGRVCLKWKNAALNSQSIRLSALSKFKSGKVPTLLGTDVASLGLEIPTVIFMNISWVAMMKMLDDGFEDKVKDLRKLKHKTLADKGILKIRSKKRKAAHSKNSLVRNIRKSISWFNDAVTSCQASDYGMNMNE